MKREIGGFLGLDCVSGREYHAQAIKLDSGRNCFKYILKAQGVSKVYLPHYISGSMVEPFTEVSTEVEFYSVDENLEIDREIDVKENEKIVVVNYFAMKTDYVNRMIEKYGDRIIVDNTHAFFHRPVSGIDTIYSPSKFVGVSDGGYLYTDTLLDEEFEQDSSWKRAVHIYGRIDKSADEFYKDYRASEDDLRYKPIRRMSKLTQHLLSSVDYRTIQLTRERNFYYMHTRLGGINELNVDFTNVEGAFVYPLLVNKEGLRDFLIQNKIYVASYWPRVLNIPEASEADKNLTKHLVALPIDQRYDLRDMDDVVNHVLRYLS